MLLAASKVEITGARTRARVPCGATLLAALAWTAAAAANLKVAVADLQGRPLAEAVVYAIPAAGSAAAPDGVPRAVIDQVHKTFVPLVSVIRAGTEVRFPNSDNIRHSIYSFSPAKVFSAKLYSGKEAAPVVFDKAGLVVLGCNIHDQMVAWIVVVDTPYFGKTGADGMAELKELAPGDYQLRSWYPARAFEPRLDTLHVAAAGAQIKVSLDAAASPLPTVPDPGHDMDKGPP
jgi:plastocyanin